jgi:gamma-glutamylcyclotransferase (GGCT)/AIG2-like uncharacterized protein YtfP
MRPRIFVYGSLLSRASEGRRMAGARLHSPATVPGTLYAMPEGYPALVPGGPGQVRGEIYELAGEADFGALDEYEGIEEGLYLRERIETSAGAAWIYVAGLALAVERGILIESGDWIQWCRGIAQPDLGTARTQRAPRTR